MEAADDGFNRLMTVAATPARPTAQPAGPGSAGRGRGRGRSQDGRGRGASSGTGYASRLHHPSL